MTKYVAFKVFETNGKDEHLDERMRALGLRDMAIVHGITIKVLLRLN